VAELAVTAVGAPTAPGIVAAVAEVLQERGGNVEDSAMTILGGHFAIVLLVEIDDEPEDLRTALLAATVDLGLTVSVTAADGGGGIEPTHLLSVYGADKPGILAGVTRALADAGANVTDLETRVLGADDEPVYAMVDRAGRGDDGERGGGRRRGVRRARGRPHPAHVDAGDLLRAGPPVVRYPARVLKGLAGPVGAIGGRERSSPGPRRHDVRLARLRRAGRPAARGAARARSRSTCR
jgi:glycine cleavage system transcriptional repressor